jgi:molybdopterin-guanine dinucleotide biosynthesis adapter protein
LLKIEVWRLAAGKPALYPEDPFIVAVATDAPAQLPQATARPVLDLNDPDALAQWLVDNQDRFDYDPERYST